MNSLEKVKSYECCIIGAGPAGLGVALELTKHGVSDILIIDKNASVGGLSRTEIYDGTRFDIGPHRFFTKNKEINAIWHETLGNDFQSVVRLTRIFHKNTFFHYPVTPVDILKLGPFESGQVLLSFFASQIQKKKKIVSFEDWIVQKFGRKLYEIFFKTYTEKVWGVPCHDITSEWAAQRIKGLDALEIIKKIIINHKRSHVRTMVEEFDYPIHGAGQMYEAICDKIVSKNVSIMLKTCALKLNRKTDHLIGSVEIVDQNGEKFIIHANHFFSCIPLPNVFHMLNPNVEDLDFSVVDQLKYRDHITVNLIADGEGLFPDQWIYVHSPAVQMARLANYNNFSKHMIPGNKKTALSAEYFVFKNDAIWNETDDFLGNLAISELEHILHIQKNRLKCVSVVREPDAYPGYYMSSQGPYQRLKKSMDQLSNFSAIGRGGMYKYNNQDHSILSGILAARNYLRLPGTPYVLWEINADDEYHEGGMRLS